MIDGDGRGKTMSEQTDQPRPDAMEAWREWLTQTERQFNSFFNEAMNAEPFARGMGGYVEATAAFQRTMADVMQRYLTFMNMPSRTDVGDLGETLSRRKPVSSRKMTACLAPTRQPVARI